MGDAVDSIPGVPKVGPKKAYETLKGVICLKEAYFRVLDVYKAAFNERAEEELLEQGRLLWMTRELEENNKPKLWELPFADTRGIEKEYELQPGDGTVQLDC